MRKGLKSYPPTWEGELILACWKCQKKLKGDKALRPLAKLNKTVKRFNEEHPDHALHVIKVPCMDLCPKDGVTVCSPAREQRRLVILRTAEDIEQLYDAF